MRHEIHVVFDEVYAGSVFGTAGSDRGTTADATPSEFFSSIELFGADASTHPYIHTLYGFAKVPIAGCRCHDSA